MEAKISGSGYTKRWGSHIKAQASKPRGALVWYQYGSVNLSWSTYLLEIGTWLCRALSKGSAARERRGNHIHSKVHVYRRASYFLNYYQNRIFWKQDLLFHQCVHELFKNCSLHNEPRKKSGIKTDGLVCWLTYWLMISSMEHTASLDLFLPSCIIRHFIVTSISVNVIISHQVFCVIHVIVEWWKRWSGL